MSHTEPDPDLVRIGLADEWIEWFDRAFAEIERERLADWRPTGLWNGSPAPTLIHDERTHVQHDLVPLIRASVREHTISRHPWEFTP